jgi:CheY-like chemotaxis protein
MSKLKKLKCILLIDDDAATNILHKFIIKKTGINVFVQVTPNGKEALDYLMCKGGFSETEQQPQPGIIFLDINMPIMDGWEFLDEYHSLPDSNKADMVIMMLTTSINPDERKRAEQMIDLKGFINKPLTVEVLSELVAKHFDCHNENVK